MSLLKKIDYSEYRNTLLRAFPQAMRTDVVAVVDILPFSERVIKLSDSKFHKVNSLIHATAIEVRQNGEPLVIPCRLYFNEPDPKDEAQLTKVQKIILNCIYLRHHNGYIRQKRLENLLNEHEPFMIPFTFQLLGEYIYQIIEVLDKHIDGSIVDVYRSYMRENPEYARLTENRVVSYWNEYYRGRFSKLKNYLGHKIITKLHRDGPKEANGLG